MTLLALIGPNAQSEAAALAWLSCALAGEHNEHDPQNSAMLVVTPDRHTHLLASLPAALQRRPPASWPHALETGFHPLRLGKLNLVLCVGHPETVLPDCVGQARNVWVGQLDPAASLASPSAHELMGQAAPASSPLATRIAPLIARLCADQAELQWETLPTSADMSAWLAAGFKLISTEPADLQTSAHQRTEQRTPEGFTGAHARYEPRWPVPPWQAVAPSQAVVIGAGLAGAAVALCLVRAGWQVCLLDQHGGPAQAASGLPVGMLSAHVTGRETVMSALSRVGMPLHMRELLDHVPEGHGWQHTHVTNLKGVESS
ncbi:MAG: FAD-dependent oxidoreductase, partial [Burkholderiales bacterium]|nr:FAD-dependent oxidoreductase [Burkholderiales bacterium]